jgi:serine/threonine protein kinase
VVINSSSSSEPQQQHNEPTASDLANNITNGNNAVMKVVKQEVAKLTAAFESLTKSDKYAGAFYKGDPSSVIIFEDQLLGSGAFSTVFVASMSGKKIAAKRLNPDPRRDAQQHADATAREAQMLKNSDDPNVVRCYGVLVQKPYTYILLEKCECNLQEFVFVLARDLKLQHRVYLVASIARAISHLHSQQIVFADLKPQNVLISTSGECRLADFGSAASITSSTDSSLLATGVSWLAFAAPELRTSKPSFSSDVYALGVVACEIITGEPFHPIASFEPENFGDNDALLNIIKRCMAKDPSKRLRAATVADSLCNEVLPLFDPTFADEAEDEMRNLVSIFRQKVKTTMRGV